MGVNHSTKGTETVNAINNLALLTGNIGRAGRVAVLDHRPVQRDGHARGRLHLEPARLPQVRERGRPRRSWRRSGTSPVERIPTARGLAYPDIIEAALDRRIRALWIIAHQPGRLVSRTYDVLRQALRSLEFLVVQDGFHPTPTTELARPGAAGRDLGREGRHLHQLRAARQQGRTAPSTPPGEARSDFDIFLALADELGVRDELFPGLDDAGGRVRRMAARVGRAASATTPA